MGFKKVGDLGFEPIQPTILGESVLEIRNPFRRIVESGYYPTVIRTGLSLSLPTGYIGIITESYNADEDWFPFCVCSSIYRGGEIIVRIYPRLRYDECMDIEKGSVIAHMVIQKVETLSV